MLRDVLIWGRVLEEKYILEHLAGYRLDLAAATDTELHNCRVMQTFTCWIA